MKLIYKILWFEDDPDIVNEYIGPDILKYLDDNGFVPEIIHLDSGKEFEKYISDNFDLILTDLNLNDEDHPGDKIIKLIREHKILTEVLLYSGNSAGIEELINRNDDGMLERVSFSVGTRNLSEKAIQIVALTIKKVQHVNNLRGLVLAETSELDERMNVLITQYYDSSSPEEKTKLQEYILKMIKKSLQSDINKIEKFDQGFIDILYSRYFDAFKRFRTVKSIIEETTPNDDNICLKCIEQYEQEILQIRNLLAHVKESVVDGNTVLQSNLPGKSIITFNEEFCTKIRKDIKKHLDNLEKVGSYIA